MNHVNNVALKSRPQAVMKATTRKIAIKKYIYIFISNFANSQMCFSSLTAPQVMSLWVQCSKLFCKGRNEQSFRMHVFRSCSAPQFLFVFFFGHVLARSRLNVAKTEFMVISSRQKMQSLNDKTINVNVEGVKINQTDHSKALGLNIDENLSLKEHIHATSKKVASSIIIIATVAVVVCLRPLKVLSHQLC